MSLTRNTALAAGLSALALLGLAAHPAAASTNLLVNGNFGSPGTSSYTTTVTGWADNGGQYGVVTNAYLNGGSSPLGGQSLFLNDLQAYQVLPTSDFTVGQTYILTGGVIQNKENLSYTTPASTSVFEIVATQSTSTHTTVNAPGPNTGVVLTSQSVTALSSMAYTYVTPLTFTYMAGDGPIDVVLLNPGHKAGTSSPGQVQSDFGNLNLSAAPEPSEIGMMALLSVGLGTLMLRARRRTTLAA